MRLIAPHIKHDYELIVSKSRTTSLCFFSGIVLKDHSKLTDKISSIRLIVFACIEDLILLI